MTSHVESVPPTHDSTRRADFLRSLGIYVATRSALGVFVWLTGQYYDCHGNRCSLNQVIANNFLLNGLFQWDARNYVLLLQRGYYIGEGYDTTAPFFPGFPSVAWLFGKVMGSALAGGIVANHLASIGGGYLIARLCRALRVGEAEGTNRELVARETTLFWLASPLAFFQCVYLTEALFAFASVLMLWSVTCGRWGWVLGAGILVTATRNAGVIVVAAAAVLAWERRAEVRLGWTAWLCIGLSPLGLLALMAWQYRVLGDPWAWAHTQVRWNRFLTTPWRTIADEWMGWPSVASRSADRMYRVQELLALALTAPLLFMRQRLRLPWALLLLGTCEWLLPLSSHALPSAARYQSGNLYFALAIPALLAQRPMLRGLCWMLFGMVMAWYASTFPFGVWAS